MADFAGLIQKKRDGGEHTGEELSQLVSGFMCGDMPDYQMSAWLMAVVFRGLTPAETLALNDAEVASGERLDLGVLGRPVVDKHSTGGVGDKVTMVLAPLVASCGVIFGKMSGRGLGHTGGTIDKLESIPGFVTEMGPERFRELLGTVGVCVAGQSSRLAPADGRIYALRDVTATVDSNPLVAASIMSKKIASGAAAVVMDVKMGRGAFIRNRGQAAGVFSLMKMIGEARGIAVRGIISPMDAPLGRAVGNALEVAEAVEALRGEGPPDLMAVVRKLAVLSLESSDAGLSGDAAGELLDQRLAEGAALAKFGEWVEAQGGDTAFIDNPGALPQASHVLTVRADRSGFVGVVDALEVGLAARDLGAGRLKKGDRVDSAVGVRIETVAGDEVSAGDLLASVHASSPESGAAAAARVAAAISIALVPPEAGWRLVEL
ncbi:MAG: thymidine phosphorylase [Gaiellales bacterium]|nr:MAG: thymidine phosphorylase [Gaiellales bacterium]